MYLTFSRLFCLTLAMLASHLFVSIGTISADEKGANRVPPPMATLTPTITALEEELQTPLPKETQPTGLAVKWQHETRERNAIGEECLDLDSSFAIQGAKRSKQHTAPEVVLRFGSGCTEAEFVHWKLSSRDTPCAKPAIPHGPLAVELLVDQPIDFVELMFDGKPLEPTSYASASPLGFSLPCPAPGQHWLQARYLSGNVWSHYSKPIRFEVRLPPQPRIIAASDFDRDPTPLARTSVTSIRTHSIKVHVADVSRSDSIVAYIDGNPLPLNFDAQVDVNPEQIDRHFCCHVLRVEGVVIPGIHKLTVRVVGCSGACSLTSEPSNAIAFHYYDEDLYLLKPGAGCNNNQQAKNHSKFDLPSPLDPRRLVSYPKPSSSQEVLPESVTATEQIPTAETGPELPRRSTVPQIHNAQAVQNDGNDNGVRHAQERAHHATVRAAQEWEKTTSRIAEVEANVERVRAENVSGPPSPFYFSSVAHFPIREFGLRGEPLDRDGILIYEDMEFSFDRNGDYKVRFRASAPAMPATMRLQFQIQPHRHGPWFTVTLAPIEFPYPTAKSEKSECSGTDCGQGLSSCGPDSKDCCGKARECVCMGNSQILKRCFGEMGQDAKIRRSGTARIGFGVNVPN